MFSLKIHHRGVFVGFPERRYVNGQEAYIDLIDIDTFFVLELSSFMKELGYTYGRPMFYHFKVPNNDLDYGHRALACDEEVISPLKDEFRAGMRDLLGLDGAFMKGPFPGQVLPALCLDSNNGIYPMAYAIVEAENKDSWTWFLECLGEDLNLGARNMAANRQDVGLPENWALPTYRLETWKQMYSFTLSPINGITMWPSSDVPTTLLPPFHHTQVGRPRKNRRRGAHEDDDIVKGAKLSRSWKFVTCSKCHQLGHNQRSCKGQQKKKCGTSGSD
nr:hypothetical protein [Tanacetum cinerariifolium]